MELSLFTDYSLRLLIYASLSENRPVTVSDAAKGYGISENHLVKVAHHLGKMGWLETKRGRSGGIRMAVSPETICLGDVIRSTENLDFVTCLSTGPASQSCPICGACVLKQVVTEARDAFLATFDRYTLKDLLAPGKYLRHQLHLSSK